MAIAVLTAGCGSQHRLTPEQNSRLDTYELAFSETALDGGEYGRTLRGVDWVIALYRQQPQAVTDDGRTVRQVLKDAAATLDPYQPDLVRRLDRELQ